MLYSLSVVGIRFDTLLLQSSGYAHLLEVGDLDMQIQRSSLTKVTIDRAKLGIYLAADSISALAAFGADFASLLPKEEPK